VQLAQVQDGGTAGTDSSSGGPDGASSGCVPPSCDAGSTADSSSTDSGAGLADAAETSTGPLPHSVVLFGGDGPTFFTDTWEWDGASWHERNVAGPPPRYDHAMAGLNGKVILFGGQGESGTLGDTWQWDGTSWTQLKIPGPTPRFGHRMTTLANKIVLFGGTTASSGDVCDTWEFDGTSWTATGATLTTGLHCVGHAIAPLDGLVYLFGGVGAYGDTWAYDGTSWKQVSSTGPVGRAWPAMAATQWCCTEQPPPPSIILFGGQVNANEILSDTWQFDGAKWTQLAATGLPDQPPPRWDPGIAMFQGPPGPGQGGLVLFGGAQGIPPGGWLGDTWVLQTPGGGWTKANVSSPPERQVYTMAGR
jgi:hypothetical protein